jgi:two-component system response regulator YesN
MPNDVTSRPLLLLVEDEAPLAFALCESLSDQFEIEVAGNVAEARMLLGSRKFDIILSDHMLPGKQQGLEFLMEALSQQPNVKRILMTGYLNPELLSRSASLAQLSACLIKPFEISQLRKELDEALGRR